ncbi:MAG TPA: VOC family protein [Candidatus Dormibacteraeota bacterium]|jgi:catechol 2,3-dioxygenase-like lactoylglutathione lyase family enzyme|nr:VOC family protein [Candidatus Dormibacteraeota bacterium]
MSIAPATSPITHVRYVGMAVPDLSRATRFYEDTWGLQPVAGDSGIAFFGAGNPEQYILRLREDESKRAEVVGFGVATDGDVDELAVRLATGGVRLAHEPRVLDTPGGGYGLRFFDPDGRCIEVSSNVAQRGFREVEPGEGRPRRLSHVVFNTPDINRLKTFYETALGFRLSDWLEDFMCFLRCQSDHHTVALFQSPHASLNHVSFEMLGIDEFMRGTGNLMRRGHSPIWGPGRHGPGNNTFAYFLDPNAFVVEYTTMLDRVDEDRGWCPKVWRAIPEESDLWGTAGPLTKPAIDAMLNDPDTIWQAPPI